jgi:hypothetical protein
VSEWTNIGSFLVVVVLLVAQLVYTVRVYERLSSGSGTSTNKEDSETTSAVSKNEPPSTRPRHAVFRMFGTPLIKDLGQGVPDLATATSEDERDFQQWEREHGKKDDDE